MTASRHRPWWLTVWWRKPWRSPAPLPLSRRRSLRVNLHNLAQWVMYAHDCRDPAIGCSCSGGHRFPAAGGAP